MKRLLMLLLGFGSTFGPGCQAHQHGNVGTELVTIDLTSGLG